MSRIKMWVIHLIVLLMSSCQVTPSATSISTSSLSSSYKFKIEGSQNIQMTDCQSYTLSITDNNGKSAVSTATISIANLIGGQGSFYQDSSCKNLVTSLTFPKAQSQIKFYYKNNQSESVGLYLTNGDQTIKSNILTVSVQAKVIKLLKGPIYGYNNFTLSSKICSILLNNELWCINQSSSLNSSISANKILSSGTNIVDAALGANSICALSNTGDILCGGGCYERNGTGDILDLSFCTYSQSVGNLSPLYSIGVSFPSAIKIISYLSYTQVTNSSYVSGNSSFYVVDAYCILTNLGQVYCQGDPSYSKSRSSNTMSSDYLSFKAAFPGIQVVDIVSTNNYRYNSICVLDVNSNIYCWGGDISTTPAGLLITYYTQSSVTLVSPTLRLINSGLKAKSISMIGDSLCAILINGETRCFGNNEYYASGGAIASTHGATGNLTSQSYYSNSSANRIESSAGNLVSFKSLSSSAPCGISNNSSTGLDSVYCWGQNPILGSDYSTQDQYAKLHTKFSNPPYSSISLANNRYTVYSYLNLLCALNSSQKLDCLSTDLNGGRNQFTSVDFLGHSFLMGVGGFSSSQYNTLNTIKSLAQGVCGYTILNDSLNSVQTYFNIGTTIQLSASDSNIHFYSDSNCTKEVTSVSVNDLYQTQVLVYLKSNVASSNFSITATSPLMQTSTYPSSSTTVRLNITSSPTGLVAFSPDNSITDTVCSRLSIFYKDVNGSEVPADSSWTVSANVTGDSSDPGSWEFYDSLAACQASSSWTRTYAQPGGPISFTFQSGNLESNVKYIMHVSGPGTILNFNLTGLGLNSSNSINVD